MPSSRRLPTAAIYSALNALSQGFEQALDAMDLLNRAGLKRADLFAGCRIMTEEAASWACQQVVEAVRERELSNWTISGQNWQQWQKRNEDPGDLLPVLQEGKSPDHSTSRKAKRPKRASGPATPTSSSASGKTKAQGRN